MSDSIYGFITVEYILKKDGGGGEAISFLIIISQINVKLKDYGDRPHWIFAQSSDF